MIGHLKKDSPRYEGWRKILETDEVPVSSVVPFEANLGGEKDTVYPLDLPRLTAEQRIRLIDFIVEKFEEERATVEAELDSVGFPIRASDVIV